MQLKVGLALYTLLRELTEDYLGTLEKVKSAGFSYIEYVEVPRNPDGTPVASAPTPREIGQKAKELGLTAVSSHVNVYPGRNLEKMISENAEMGAKQIVLPFEVMFTMEDVKRVAALCQTLGSKCKEHGMSFCYHNHYHEFVKIDGKYALEWLVELTDPSLVGVELDTYWAARGGESPVNLLEKLGSRCTMLHQKDLSSGVKEVNLLAKPLTQLNAEGVFARMKEMAPSTDIVPVGWGCMDIPHICRKVEELGFARYILIELDSMCRFNETEHGDGPSPLEAVTLSLGWLKKLLS